MNAQRTSGRLAGGTAWSAAVPDQWNGVMVSDADLTDFRSHADFDAWCLHSGYAIVRTSREPAAWQVDRMLANRHEVHDLFARQYGAAATVVATGESLGGMVSRAIAERDADLADAAVAMNGGGSGTIGLWNAKQDAAFAVRVLLAPSDGVDLVAAVAAAEDNAAGRARATLAAALAMQPTWSNPDLARPEPDDILGQAAAMRSSLGFGLAPGIRADVERLAGGVFAGNEHVDYTELGRRLGRRRSIVDALYERAGISVDADLNALDGAERIATDAAAVRWAEAGVWSGHLRMPLVTLYAIGDPAAVPEEERAYQNTVEKSTVQKGGAESMLDEVYLDAAGHCRFTVGERAVAVERALQALSGDRPPASPALLNESATAIDGEGPTWGALPATRHASFVDYEPDDYIRPWDRWDIAAASAKENVQC